MKIQTSEYNKECAESVGVQISSLMPLDVSEKIMFTMDMNPKNNKACDYIGQTFSTSTGTLNLQTPASPQLYVTHIVIGMIKDVTCDQATGTLNVSVPFNGADFNLIKIPVLALTAQQVNLSVSLSRPIKVDPGGIIKFTGAFTAGAMVRSVNVAGFNMPNV